MQEFDRNHVWHPYAAMPGARPNHLVVEANGVHLRLADGRQVIDAMSSWWCAIHGHRHPAIVAAMQHQLHQFPHVMFGGLTHAPAVELARALIDLVPAPLEKVFFSDSGSVAVEVAMKMARQHWCGREQPRKRGFLALRGGYHGDTLAAMSVSDPETGRHHLFGPLPLDTHFARRPPPGFAAAICAEWLGDVAALFESHARSLAAVIVEPVLQGAGGMHVYSPGYLARLRDLCDRYEVLLVLDEIATGFGRTGTMFACDHAAVVPDIMCVGKALTGGHISLAATLCTADVAEHVCAEPFGALMHGPTYMANPLACAAGNASVALLRAGNWNDQVSRVATVFNRILPDARHLRSVADVRVCGAIGAIEMKTPVDVVSATEAALRLGVWIRPFGRLIYAMPPYVASEDELRMIATALVEAASVSGRNGS
jgi:adenosylmethionine-8-amino-7-oxononanoate aminotransferase